MSSRSKKAIDLLTKAGLYEVELRSLADVRAAQERLTDVLVDAAEERWPDLYERSEPDRLAMVWDNARSEWPDVQRLAETLNEAEREMIRSSKQVLA